MTTRIEGAKYDGLLGEKGGLGFPSLMFLDANGEILAQQDDRSIAGFEATLANLKEYEDLKARQAKGEKGLEVPIFLAELKLGKLKYEQAKTRATELKDLTEAQRAEIDAMLFDLEVSALMEAYQSGGDEGKAALEKLVAYAKAGKQPSPSSRLMYWGFLSYIAAEETKDPDLLEKCITNLRALPESKDYEKQLQELEKQLKEMRKGAP